MAVERACSSSPVSSRKLKLDLARPATFTRPTTSSDSVAQSCLSACRRQIRLFLPSSRPPRQLRLSTGSRLRSTLRLDLLGLDERSFEEQVCWVPLDCCVLVAQGSAERHFCSLCRTVEEILRLPRSEKVNHIEFDGLCEHFSAQSFRPLVSSFWPLSSVVAAVLA